MTTGQPTYDDVCRTIGQLYLESRLLVQLREQQIRDEVVRRQQAEQERDEALSLLQQRKE
jgi:hypothetical protein